MVVVDKIVVAQLPIAFVGRFKPPLTVTSHTVAEICDQAGGD